MLATMVLFYEQPCAKRAAVKGVRKKWFNKIEKAAREQQDGSQDKKTAALAFIGRPCPWVGHPCPCPCRVHGVRGLLERQQQHPHPCEQRQAPQKTRQHEHDCQKARRERTSFFADEGCRLRGACPSCQRVTRNCAIGLKRTNIEVNISMNRCNK